MGKVYPAIDDRIRSFVLAQPVFFVATAPASRDGHLNISPKGLRGTFAVIDEHRVSYLDYTGSGIETVAHLRDDGRIVLMFCAFAGPPNIVRLHGRGRTVPVGTADFDELLRHFPEAEPHAMRSIVDVRVDRVSDSCGFSVPYLDYVGERTLLTDWASRKSDDDIAEYWASRNAASIDGLPGFRGAERDQARLRPT